MSEYPDHDEFTEAMHDTMTISDEVDRQHRAMIARMALSSPSMVAHFGRAKILADYRVTEEDLAALEG